MGWAVGPPSTFELVELALSTGPVAPELAGEIPSVRAMVVIDIDEVGRIIGLKGAGSSVMVLSKGF